MKVLLIYNPYSGNGSFKNYLDYIIEQFNKNNMDLIISPQADTEIRVNFVFKPIKENYNIINPIIITPIRKGFTVVEWGGILSN